MKYFTHNLLRILGALILVAAASSVTSTMAQTTILLVTAAVWKSAMPPINLRSTEKRQDAYVFDPPDRDTT